MADTAQSGSLVSPFHRFPVIIGNIRIPIFFRFAQNPNKLTFQMAKEYQQTRTIGGYVFEHWGKKPTMMRGSVLIKKDANAGNYLGLNQDTTNLGIEDAVFNPELSTLMTLFNIDQRKLNTLYGDGDLQTTIQNGITYAVSGLSALSNPATVVTSAITMASGWLDGKDKSAYKFKEPDPASIEGYISTLTDTIILYKGVIYSGFFTEMTYEEDGRTPFTNTVNFQFLVTNTTSDWVDTGLTQTAAGRAIAGIWGMATSAVSIGSMLEDMFKDTGSDTYGHV